MQTVVTHTADQALHVTFMGDAYRRDALFKASLEQVLLPEQYSPAKLIAALSADPRIAALYAASARVLEDYTIGQHTEMVLRQYDRWLSDSALLPSQTPSKTLIISQSEFRLILALHDIGKSIPAKVEDQRQSTLAVLRELRDVLPLSSRAFQIAEVLIATDPIGTFMKTLSQSSPRELRIEMMARADSRNVTLEELESFAATVKIPPHTENPQFITRLRTVLEEITNHAHAMGLTVKECFLLYKLYYQCDTAAYTYDATLSSGKRAYPGLCFLYDHDVHFSLPEYDQLLVLNHAGFLEFSPRIKPAMDEIERAIAIGE